MSTYIFKCEDFDVVGWIHPTGSSALSGAPGQ